MNVKNIYSILMRTTKIGIIMFFTKMALSVLVGMLGLCLISYPTPHEGVMKINSTAKLYFTALLLLTAMVYVFWFLSLLQFAVIAIWIKRRDLDELNSILEKCKSDELNSIDQIEIVLEQINLRNLKTEQIHLQNLKMIEDTLVEESDRVAR
jgi:hypothetical protein